MPEGCRQQRGQLVEHRRLGDADVCGLLCETLAGLGQSSHVVGECVDWSIDERFERELEPIWIGHESQPLLEQLHFALATTAPVLRVHCCEQMVELIGAAREPVMQTGRTS